MRAEFLPMKYEGVPTVSELLRDRERFGWKCRKYSRWRQVHGSPEDPKRLHQMATALLEEGRVSAEDFAAVSAVFEKVQRWRFDKDELSVEPNRRQAWERLKVKLDVARRSPATIQSALSDTLRDSDPDPNLLVTTFMAHAIFDFIGAMGIQTKITSEGFPFINVSSTQLDTIADELGETIFGECSASWAPKHRADEALCRILNEVGLEVLSPIEGSRLPGIGDTGVEDDILIEYVDIEPTKLVQAKLVGGVVVAKINQRHRFIEQLSGVDAKSASEDLLKAIARTAIDLSSSGECVDDFLAYLGLNSSRTK